MKRFFGVILFACVLVFQPLGMKKAHATDFANLFENTINTISTVANTAISVADFGMKTAEKIALAMGIDRLTFQRGLALIAVQQSTAALIGSGANSSIIRDFNAYLYLSPQQKAMARMNTFFNTVSRGRLSSLNYEGIGGSNYDAYLVAQARQEIGGKNFVTNIQSQVADPRRMFADGNMKGIMSFVECANNPYCFTMAASQKYGAEFAREQEIAKNSNVGGFAPQITNGRITQPAAIAQNALLQIDQLGTQVIMNAKAGSDPKEVDAAVAQVWTGAKMSVAARLANYGISDEAGKQAIRNKNDQFPFSLSYNSSGVGMTAGGTTVNTGVAAYNTSMQIGNTTACLNAAIDANGNTFVMINGVKKPCPKPNGSSITVTSCENGIVGDKLCQVQCDSSTSCNGAKAVCSNGSCIVSGCFAGSAGDAYCRLTKNNTTSICSNSLCK